MENKKMSREEFVKKFKEEQRTNRFLRNIVKDNKNPRSYAQRRFNKLFCQV